jgi:hypothetical protein
MSVTIQTIYFQIMSACWRNATSQNRKINICRNFPQPRCQSHRRSSCFRSQSLRRRHRRRPRHQFYKTFRGRNLQYLQRKREGVNSKIEGVQFKRHPVFPGVVSKVFKLLKFWGLIHNTSFSL